MKPPIDNTRRQLGELGAMQADVEKSERAILARAESRLADVEKQIDELHRDALAQFGDAGERYAEMVLERGKLHQVIAQAKETLGRPVG